VRAAAGTGHGHLGLEGAAGLASAVLPMTGVAVPAGFSASIVADVNFGQPCRQQLLGARDAQRRSRDGGRQERQILLAIDMGLA